MLNSFSRCMQTPSVAPESNPVDRRSVHSGRPIRAAASFNLETLNTILSRSIPTSGYRDAMGALAERSMCVVKMRITHRPIRWRLRLTGVTVRFVRARSRGSRKLVPRRSPKPSGGGAVHNLRHHGHSVASRGIPAVNPNSGASRMRPKLAAAHRLLWLPPHTDDVPN